MVWLGLFDFVFMYDGVGAFGGAWSLLLSSYIICENYCLDGGGRYEWRVGSRWASGLLSSDVRKYLSFLGPDN